MALVDGMIAGAQVDALRAAKRMELLASILETLLSGKPSVPEVLAALPADARSVMGRASR